MHNNYLFCRDFYQPSADWQSNGLATKSPENPDNEPLDERGEMT